MQAAIGADEQREVIRFSAIVRAGDIEDSLRVLQEYVHALAYRPA
jgi:hypothetical protein